MSYKVTRSGDPITEAALRALLGLEADDELEAEIHTHDGHWAYEKGAWQFWLDARVD